MSTDAAISLAELQNFVGEFWYHYDQAHYPELAAAFAENAVYLSRSEFGDCPFEESLTADLSGKTEVMAWLTEHRQASPYPLRHHTSNLHITGSEGDITSARFYIFVNQVSNYVPFAVSSGVAEVDIRRSGDGFEFTKLSVILDARNSEPLSGEGLPGSENAPANA